MTIHKVGNKSGKALRKGLGRSNPFYQVISLPPPPTLAANLRSKVVWGWSESNNADVVFAGYPAFSVAGTVQSTTKKVGTNALSYVGGNNSFTSIVANSYLKNIIDNAGAYTISHWIRWNSFNAAAGWGMWGDTSGSWDATPGINLQVVSNNLYTVYWNGVVGQSWSHTNNAVTLSTGTWIHVVSVIGQNITNTYSKTYLNGVLHSSSSSIPLVDFWTNAQRFRLAGYALTNSATQLNGFLDEFYIFHGELVQSEIDYLYNSGSGISLL